MAGLLAILALVSLGSPAEASRWLGPTERTWERPPDLDVGAPDGGEQAAAPRGFEVFGEGDVVPLGAYDVDVFAYDAARDALEGCREVAAAGTTGDLLLTDGWTGPVGGRSRTRFALFQGLWTDPVTGIAYARNRWYDPRTASWLSEDPMGPVDSPNLYAFVGWGPHDGRDPLGLAEVPCSVDPQMAHCQRPLFPWIDDQAPTTKLLSPPLETAPVLDAISLESPPPAYIDAAPEGETFPGMIQWAWDAAFMNAFTHEYANENSPFTYDSQSRANVSAFRGRWGLAADTLDYATTVAGGRKFEILLATAVFALPEEPEVLKNEEFLNQEGRHVTNELSRMTTDAEDLIDSGEAMTERARQYKRFVNEERWYAFFFRGRAIQDEVEVMLAQSDDPLLQRIEVRPKRVSGIPDFVFHQSTGEELVLDITSPRPYTRHKALKYLETGREIIVEIYHRGRGLKRK